jgi:hypothetical protein
MDHKPQPPTLHPPAAQFPAPHLSWWQIAYAPQRCVTSDRSCTPSVASSELCVGGHGRLRKAPRKAQIPLLAPMRGVRSLHSMSVDQVSFDFARLPSASPETLYQVKMLTGQLYKPR